MDQKKASRRHLLGLIGQKAADYVAVPSLEGLLILGAAMVFAACADKDRNKATGGTGTTPPGGNPPTGPNPPPGGPAPPPPPPPPPTLTVTAGTSVLAATQQSASITTSQHHLKLPTPGIYTAVSSINGFSDASGPTGGLEYMVDGSKPGTNAGAHQLSVGSHTISWIAASNGQSVLTFPVNVV